MVPLSQIDGTAYRWLDVVPTIGHRQPPPLPSWLRCLLQTVEVQSSLPRNLPPAIWAIATSLLRHRSDFPLSGKFTDGYQFSIAIPRFCPTCGRQTDRDNLFVATRNREDGGLFMSLRCFRRPSRDAFSFVLTFDDLGFEACTLAERGRLAGSSPDLQCMNKKLSVSDRFSVRSCIKETIA